MSPGPTEPTGSPSKNDDLSGSFGRYRIVRRLGAGVMGTVYLAVDSQINDRQIALKIPLIADDGAKAAELARFQQEARAAARLLHPNICAVYDFGEINGVAYLTMSYIDGQSLAQALSKKSLRPTEAVKLMETIARAMSYAHRHGVIHRDLKPANVMLDRRGNPAIMDFGLARRTDRHGPRLTVLGETLGTPSYMAPEQFLGEMDRIGPQSDVYSLGVIFYECLAGRRPFEGTAVDVIRQLLNDNPAPISQFAPQLRGVRIDGIARKALAKNLADRFPSMDAFADALANAFSPAEAEPVVSTTVPATENVPLGTSKPSNWRSAERPSQRRSAKSSLAIKVLVVVVIAVILAISAAVWW
jgi:serine/threonine protein kinase